LRIKREKEDTVFQNMDETEAKALHRKDEVYRLHTKTRTTVDRTPMDE